MPRSVSIQTITLGRFFFTDGSLGVSSSFAVFTPSTISCPSYLISHFSCNSFPLAPNPSMNQSWYWLSLLRVVTWSGSFSYSWIEPFTQHTTTFGAACPLSFSMCAPIWKFAPLRW